MKTLFLLLMLLIQTGGKLTLEKPWTRVSAEGANTAFFFDIVNNSDNVDTLYKVESKTAKLTEIHESFKIDDKMEMRKVQSLVIQSKTTLSFKPRSYHIMLIGLKQDINENDKVEVTLYFKHAGKMSLTGKAVTR